MRFVVPAIVRKPSVLIIGISVLVAAALIASRPRQPAPVLPEKAWTVDAMPAVRGEIRPNLELYGRVESYQDAQVTAAVEADVLEVPVREGQRVAAGTVLVRLDPRDASLALRQREADVRDIDAQIRLEKRRIERNQAALGGERELLRLVEDDAERARALFVERLLSQANLDDVSEALTRQQLSVSSRELAIEESEIRLLQLDAQLMRTRALRDQAALAAERTTVTAPFDGVVSDVEVSQGDRARLGSFLMRLHNPASLELRVQIPSRHAPTVRRALTGDIAMPARVELDEATHTAHLERISGQVREGAGSVETFLGFDEPPQGARLGATVRVLLSLPPEPDAIAVPAEAIYGSDRIYRIVDGRMASLTVERVGERTLPDGRAEVIIRSPELGEADQIIVTKLSTATDGLLVKLAEPAAGARELGRDVRMAGPPEAGEN